MKYALKQEEDGRILSAWEVFPDGIYDGMALVNTLPEGDIYEYRYVDGRYIYEPMPKPEQPENENKMSVWDELDAAYQEGVDSV